MIIPFVRLVTIYIIVIVAVVAVFKRDQIMDLAGWPFDHPSSDQVAPPQTAAAAAPASVKTSDVTPVAPPAPAQAPAQEPPAIAAQTPTAPAPGGTQAAAEPAIKQPTPAPVAASQPAPQQTASLTESDLQIRLTQARRAYWAGDLAKSEALYAALAKDAPSNPDVKGELGNILYAQRRYGEAADAYFATGKLLVGHANPAQILPIIGVLQSIAPQKAETLRALATN